MADATTKGRLAVRRRSKRWALPVLAVVAGLVAKTLFDYRPVPALLNLGQNLFLTLNQQHPETLLANRPILQWVVDWIAAPLVLFALVLTLVSLPPVRWVIDRLFPDPPPFVFSDLDARRRRSMLLLERSVAPLVGRDSERADLGTLLDTGNAAAPFRWRVLLAPSGIGKTRLAIEWLADAQTQGWDVGIVDPEDRADLAGWRPRRPTALVIDEARTRWDAALAEAMLDLQAKASPRRPVRLLVIDQVMPYVKLDVALDQQRIDDAFVAPAIALQGLPPDALGAMLASFAVDPARTDLIVAESAGRPRAAIILANAPEAASYAAALSRWAEQLVPALGDPGAAPPPQLAIPLIFAALAGPIDTDRVRPHVDAIDAGPLLRFFDDADRESLGDRLPALLPDDLARELALRLLLRLDQPRREAIVTQLVAEAPARIEAALGALWRESGYETGRTTPQDTLMQWIQDRFDTTWPARIAAIVDRAKAIVGDSASVSNLLDLEQCLVAIDALASSRPFDPAIRLQEAKAAVNAINHYGTAQCPNDLERWAYRLTALADHPVFSADSAIRLEEAKGAANAIHYYGTAQRWDDLESWGNRLTALADHPVFSADPAIRLAEAKGAVNAIHDYGAVLRWADLERWGNRLTALADDPAFVTDPTIRLCEAESAINAIGHYGAARRWSDLERWGNHLTDLANNPAFVTNPAIRLCEAKSAVNTINDYGTAQRWGDLERWGKRLTKLADHPVFIADPAIRLREAKGAVNAITDYGTAQRWDDLERWGNRLTTLADHPVFTADPAIRLEEAKAAVNAITCYGTAQRWDDLERWGKRLTKLADHPAFTIDRAIRLQEAKGAVNAIISYNEAGLHGSGRHFSWNRRLAHVAQKFPSDSDIQAAAKKFDLTFTTQMRRKFEPYGRFDRSRTRAP